MATTSWVNVMKARKLIEGAIYGPTQIAVLARAFDEAWTEIEPTISKRPSAIEASRFKLANAVLAAAQNGPIVFERIKAEALKSVPPRPPSLH